MFSSLHLSASVFITKLFVKSLIYSVLSAMLKLNASSYFTAYLPSNLRFPSIFHLMHSAIPFPQGSQRARLIMFVGHASDTISSNQQICLHINIVSRQTIIHMTSSTYHWVSRMFYLYPQCQNSLLALKNKSFFSTSFLHCILQMTIS